MPRSLVVMSDDAISYSTIWEFSKAIYENGLKNAHKITFVDVLCKAIDVLFNYKKYRKLKVGANLERVNFEEYSNVIVKEKNFSRSEFKYKTKRIVLRNLLYLTNYRDLLNV